MGCGISKFDIPKGGDASRVYTRLSIVHRSNDRLSRSVQREEACIDKESSGEEDLYGGDDGIPYMQSPSFRVYCVPSQLDDGISEGDSTPAEIKEDKKWMFKATRRRVQVVDLGRRMGQAARKRSHIGVGCVDIYSIPHDSIKLKGSFADTTNYY